MISDFLYVTGEEGGIYLLCMYGELSGSGIQKPLPRAFGYRRECRI